MEEAGFEDFRNGLSISGAEVIEVVKKLHVGRDTGIDKIQTDFLKALDVVGLS